MMYAYLLLAAASATAAPQPPVAVTDSPPPLIEVREVLPAYPIVRIAIPARPKVPLSTYFRTNDYPPAALRAKQEGRVAVVAIVSADGRTTGCQVVGRSGSPSLAAATCAIIRRRGRFHPALDRDRRAVSGTYSFAVHWRLPPGPVIVSWDPMQQPPIARSNSPAPPVVTVHVPPPPLSPPIVFAPPPPPAPPPPGARLVRSPQLRAHQAVGLITPDDYPESARAWREQGRVDFTLAVGADGRVTGCTVTRSSGSSALDSATCQIMRRRARFTPAVDSTGQPAAGTYAMSFNWRLPR